MNASLTSNSQWKLPHQANKAEIFPLVYTNGLATISTELETMAKQKMEDKNLSNVEDKGKWRDL